jgi:isochorismate pyruvate lyase
MKEPDQCENMIEIRTEIDKLDYQVIKLIGQRFEYVQAAAKFKANVANVKAQERFSAMLQQRRVWAEEVGLNADAIEKMYRDLVNHFIEEEIKHWQRSQAS